jgi:hypothetical protein
VSLNLLGMDMGDSDRAAIDWAPPTAFGLDNSLRLADAAAAAGVMNDQPTYLPLVTRYIACLFYMHHCICTSIYTCLFTCHHISFCMSNSRFYALLFQMTPLLSISNLCILVCHVILSFIHSFVTFICDIHVMSCHSFIHLWPPFIHSCRVMQCNAM